METQDGKKLGAKEKRIHYIEDECKQETNYHKNITYTQCMNSINPRPKIIQVRIAGFRARLNTIRVIISNTFRLLYFMVFSK